MMRVGRLLARAMSVVAVGMVGVAACATPGRKQGDVCPPPELGAAACTDAWHALTCRLYTWQLDECRGPDGCTTRTGAPAHCDQRVAERGDSCGVGGAHACSLDRRELLRCDGARMVAAQACRGDGGCVRANERVEASCDRGSARVGDPCENDGSHCAEGDRDVLRCDASHRYVHERSCLGRKGCRRLGSADSPELVCDTSVGEVGDPCDAPSDAGAWCSADGKQVNTCRDGLLTRRTACPEGCKVRWEGDRSYRIDCEDGDAAL